MGAALLPIALAASAGTSLLQFGQRRAAGRIQQAEAETQAAQAEVTTVQKERERKRDLVAALARSTVAAGARGVAAFEGSPLSQRRELIKEEDISTERSRGAGERNARAIRARGKIARQQANAAATGGLLGDAIKLVPLIPTRR